METRCGIGTFYMRKFTFRILLYRIVRMIVSGVLAGGPGLAILGGRKNEKGASIPRRILKVGGKKRI